MNVNRMFSKFYGYMVPLLKYLGSQLTLNY